MKRQPAVLITLLITVCMLICTACDNIPSENKPQDRGTSTSSFSDCQQWIESSHDTLSEIPEMTCTNTPELVREEIFNNGAGIFPAGDNMYYVVWFPETWDTASEKKIIFALHKEEGCAENTFNDWYDTLQQTADDYQYGLVALQYYDKYRPYQFDKYDNSTQIYSNILSIMKDIASNCPVQNSMNFLYGFSGGSSEVFSVAVQDRKETGLSMFTSFIADSGAWPVEGPFPHTILNTVKDDKYKAFHDADFWLYCDAKFEENACESDECDACSEMEYAGELVESYGGKVDQIYLDNKGTEGIFNVPGGGLSNAINELFDYIFSFQQ